MVLARAAQLWQANVTGWNCLLRAAADVAAASSLTYPVTTAVAAARRVGRRKALAHLEEQVVSLVDQLTEDPLWERKWHAVTRSLWGEEIVSDPELARRAHRSDKALLLEVTTSCLAAEAVADVINPAQLTHARGAWLEALGRTTDIPGPEWSAAPEVLDIVMGLLEPLSAQQLGAIVQLHRWAMDGKVEGWDAYPGVFSRVSGWALVGPAARPWVGRLGSLPAW